ncbi:DUF2163 domain-containing protein [Alphaproteobacteria bacterium KMM 3653]|uniref:DUF2163 domain-containing protein n=1 Tax=Harenicola maris TaxID=2841044 RepID=A0AAP2G7A2_9RHOB|nr:DUF2163 domain-containing protein [Harenicola maris]
MSAETARQALLDHAAGGLTSLCRCWKVERRDGVSFGFTDHDCEVSFEGTLFKADSGLVASALVQTTGLSVDNTEALGALSDASVTEADIMAGRFDGASVQAWLVNWADPEARFQLFAGSIGEVSRSAGAFRAELRGLTEALNQPQGAIYQSPCSAVLGDGKCRFNTNAAGYFATPTVAEVTEARVFLFDGLEMFQARWFERGMLRLTSGAGAGLSGVIKNDRSRDGRREIELWAPIEAEVAVGDALRLEAGCDKQAATCRAKFANFDNFRGFPTIPGEDWLTSYPTSSNAATGGPLTSSSPWPTE